MHLHILGICGTFMGSLALLAKQRGFQVSGCDANVYPPMSTQLAEQGIELLEGYLPEHLQAREGRKAPDLVIVGNAMSRGNPCVEYVLDNNLPYTSGPQWLADHVLQDKWVMAVAGTHGKTTTSSMLAWVLEDAGMAPGFLIGGVPGNFGVSARLGDTPFFVVEADEYDTAFFDKRSKFVHYRPRTAILNNLEFDHADIFDDLAAIERQFHHLVRTVPSQGQLIVPNDDANLARVLEQGCWSPVVRFGADDAGQGWSARLLSDDGSTFEVLLDGDAVAEVHWSQTGRHSVMNGLAAMAAARHVGVTPEHSAAALGRFQGVKRRMEKVGEAAGICLYDDFAHHPTAIQTTLEGLRARAGDKPVVAVIEPRSNTMRLGSHQQALAPSTASASEVLWYQPPGLSWGLDAVVADSPVPAKVFDNVDAIIEAIKAYQGSGAEVVIMSNGGFEGIHQRMLAALQTLQP
ncbi:UDP-N-acetylmuramate:L-alanyl-gamma-D-glutamyl-meso-diaminopimelate ligase [Motiliproteus coralliicola]|uniref:UDP-N-acetylmuramate--L-alanyl-gamma-D-glutamyl-meso-2,6-diaminoheptandioate ligase n=1 Tax=Motiliproteus coralliicola TaxID=2283196 RepID=A0A369WE49_9GAMM|nr:UDP-N-acetylmuramate:L-alanyl-gamma-D-glutamyl-meso-diaminopimelate ligase [Motiliproteus coralliicola]RDE19927.1 UDP-N-acetylmuramate:L-alanyl-gamma-D-glutamyl-meso-diaminopimelate ligase [Motiliproteus coralliicola]